MLFGCLLILNFGFGVYYCNFVFLLGWGYMICSDYLDIVYVYVIVYLIYV